MTAILGISAFYHDSAAALVVDGEIVAAAQEERFTRKKHDERFPQLAVEYCLQEAGLRPDQIDYVGFYDKPLLKFERLLETYLGFAPAGFESFLRAMPIWLRQKLYLSRELNRGLGGAYKKRFVFSEHHDIHVLNFLFYNFRDLRGAAPGSFNVLKPGSNPVPFVVTGEDAAEAIRLGLAVDAARLASRCEVFLILTDMPHGKFSNEKAKRVLGFRPKDDISALWRKADA